MLAICIQLLLASGTLALWDDPDKDDEIFNASACIFADKTSMIDKFFQHVEATSKYQIFTAPFGFGKTTNLKMLKRFVQIEVDELGQKVDKRSTSSYKLFTDKRLKISNRANIIETHLAEYPVLYFDYSDVIEFSFPKTYRKLCAKIQALYKSYEWIYKILQERYSNRMDEQGKKLANKLSLMGKMIKTKIFANDYIHTDCLCVLVEILYEYFQRKIFVFIEYYDRYWLNGENLHCKLWDFYMKSEICTEEHCDDVVHMLFQPKIDKYVEYVFATGTHPIYLKNPNFTYNTFLADHPFTQYYGFNKDEVMKILNPRAKAPITEFRHLQYYHNGYTTKKADLKLFQPSSVVTYFQHSLLSFSMENYENEKLLTDTTYEFKPHLLIDPPPLNGLWRALRIESIREKVKNLLTSENITFQLRFEDTTNGLQKNLPISLKNESPTQNMTTDLFISMLFENGYLTYTAIAGRFEIPNRSRFNVIKSNFKLYEEIGDNVNDLSKWWREYIIEHTFFS